MVKTRFAPSPTGEPHIGNIRTALFGWLFARSKKGEFLLRIEDTDKSREVEGAEEKIKESLKWLGLDWDGDILKQSDRLDIYKNHAQKLLADGNAYYCMCTPERLDELRKEQQKKKQPPRYDGKCREANHESRITNHGAENAVVRLKMPKTGKTKFNDIVRGDVEFENALIDDQVLLKSDGFPTYHLANVVDDHEMEITHVIRGEDWLSSTPKHLMLYKYLKWEAPEFAHLPMILGKDKSKLSKRHGSVSALEYKEKGYLPEALFNYLALLGWSPGNDDEILSREDIIKKFKLDGVQKSAAIFDTDKLDWINGQYIRALQPEELTQRIQDFGVKDVEETKVKLVQDRMRTLKEYTELSEFVSKLPEYKTELLIFKKSTRETIHRSLTLAEELLGTIQDKEWNQERLQHYFNQLMQQQDIKPGEILHPLRVALTGLKDSPGPFESAEALGKKESSARVKIALEKLS